ncbi:hypothetical protein HYW53_03690 [Candidatus Giovannonibacteria bacterium]|nr:hypothetical protein [Candidatus Giovannonibacteria bacterium]
MQIEIKKLSPSEVEITGELEAEKFDKFWASAVKKVNSKTKLDGFRPGNIPEKVLVDRVGEAEIMEEAAGLALSDIWPRIIKENKIEAIGRPEIVITKITKGNPLGFKIKTYSLPEINLPDYADLIKPIFSAETPVAVEEKEISDALEYIRKTKAKISEKVENSEAPKEIEELPELNDEFARSVGQFENLEALKNTLANNIKMEKTMKLRDKKRMEALDLIAHTIKIEIPQILVEAEKEKMISELKANLSQMGLEWGHYLEHIKRTAEDLRKEWASEAEKRVRYGLAIRAIREREKITASEEELKKEVEYIVSRQTAEEKGKLDPESLRDYAYGIIINEKVFQALEKNK